ncbi:MAG: DNA repair protein RecO [Desulfobulbus propionicus]|nr:MAG: DNA repair protein RecO [Desulfobulbus propionicus]
MKTHTADCFVLNTKDHGESDKLVTCYSRDHGKITGIAKGAKRSKRRFVNKLELFTRLDIMYSQPRTGSLFFIHEAELITASLSLRRAYNRYLAASYLAELILKWTGDHDSDSAIFALLEWGFSSLEKGKKELQVVALFHIRLMGLSGYQPVLSKCTACGQPIQRSQTYHVLPEGGAIACSSCIPKAFNRDSIQVTVQTLKFLQRAQQVELSHLNRLQMPDPAIQQAVTTLHRFSLHLLQHDLTGWKALISLFP